MFNGLLLAAICKIVEWFEFDHKFLAGNFFVKFLFSGVLPNFLQTGKSAKRPCNILGCSCFKKTGFPVYKILVHFAGTSFRDNVYKKFNFVYKIIMPKY